MSAEAHMAGWGLTVFTPLLFGFGYFAFTGWGVMKSREKSMDKDSELHCEINPEDCENLRFVEKGKSTGPLSPQENPGLQTIPFVFTCTEQGMLLKELKRLIRIYGMPLCDAKRSYLMELFSQCGLNEDIPGSTRFVSDEYEDLRKPKADWGNGDSIIMENVPNVIRCAMWRLRTLYPDCGRMRSVYMEYSPSGVFYRHPRRVSFFKGYEYVIIPIGFTKGTVFTFIPRERSKRHSLDEIIEKSWTDKDIDMFVPAGGVGWVFAKARFEYDFGIRPSQWHGDAEQYPGDSDDSFLKKKRKNWKFWQKSVEANEATDGRGFVILGFEGADGKKGRARSKFRRPETFMYGRPMTDFLMRKWDPTDHRAGLKEDAEEIGAFRWVLKHWLRGEFILGGPDIAHIHGWVK